MEYEFCSIPLRSAPFHYIRFRSASSHTINPNIALGNAEKLFCPLIVSNILIVNRLIQLEYTFVSVYMYCCKHELCSSSRLNVCRFFYAFTSLKL
ncbi:hypothetical protein QL285_004217 [Trifolium repens]|nr:hypothetical protein QL285_004217 [Trifolium repens]